MGADYLLNVNNAKNIVNAVKSKVGDVCVDYVIECAGTEQALNDAILMTNRGGKICLAAFPHGQYIMHDEAVVYHTIHIYIYIYTYEKGFINTLRKT